MKQKLILASVLLLSASASAGILYGFNPLSTDDWKGLAHDFGEWIENAYQSTWNKLQGVPECAKVIPLGAEWAMKKASYEVAVVGVQVAKETLDTSKAVQKLDPRITALRAEIAKIEAQKAAVQASRQVALGNMESVRGLATATETVGVAASKIIQSGFDLQKVEFKATLDELVQEKLPPFAITAVVAGKKIDFKMQLDVKDTAVNIAKEITTTAVNTAHGIEE